VFQVFAVQASTFSEVPGRHEVYRVLEEHALAAGHCVGTFGRGEPAHDSDSVEGSVDSDFVAA
jgi:hypothetical protein